MKPEEIPNVDIIGYDLQKKAGLEVGLKATEGGRPCVILFFGIPGTGKSEFPYYLANKLNHDFGQRFFMAYVNCDMIATIPASTKDIIEELDNKVQTASMNLPCIVVFDELDSLSSSIQGAQRRAQHLTRWLRNYMDRVPGRTLAIGTTNNPLEMDFSIWRRIRAYLFFDLPQKDVICQLMEKLLKVDNSREICNIVCDELNSHGFETPASDIVNACGDLQRNHGEPKGLSKEEICEILIALIPGYPQRLIERYWKANSDIIDRAQKQMEYWKKQFERKGRSL